MICICGRRVWGNDIERHYLNCIKPVGALGGVFFNGWLL